MPRILAALSGGVDSSVAAALLCQQGHEVVGAYMKNWINEEKIAGNCPWQEDIEDARRVADQLGIEFRVVNLIREYRERVVKYLLKGYEAGLTPNPDVMCNREMKFGVFRTYAEEEGFERIATGHYARRVKRADGSSDILRGRDGNKDQSYFLAWLRQEQVRAASFPIGDLTKPEVRRIAEDMGLVTAKKKDSQGICFIGEVKMADFLRTFVSDKPGRIVDVKGNTLGNHSGLHLYTLGQRRGIGVASNQDRKAYVVVGKRAESNELVIAFDETGSPGLYATRCRISGISFVNKGFPELAGTELSAQPRYRTMDCRIDLEIYNAERGEATIAFHEPQRALTPGQVCAFYSGDTLLGGGVFEHI